MTDLKPLDIVDDRTPYQKWRDGDGPRAKPGYVYVASSWRNHLQQAVVGALRSCGVQHYDFRNPGGGDDGLGGFRWSEIDPSWLAWSPAQWRDALKHPVAKKGFALDRDAMLRADCCVLVLPCGRSAHLEAGHMAGRGKPVVTLALNPVEPELMALLLGPPENIATTMNELFDLLGVD